MSEPAEIENNLIKAFEWAFTGNPEDYKSYVQAKQNAHPQDTPRQLAERILASYAHKAAFQGFAAGIFGNPLYAAGGAIVDMAALLRFYASMTAYIGYLANPHYFADPDWRNDAILMLAGPKVVAELLGNVAVQGGKEITKVLLRKYLSKRLLRALQRLLLKWLGKKITQRAIFAKAIPLAGGIIGGVWNYAEVRIIGKRIMQYHFDGVLAL
jgi:hypothetical protein